MTNFRVHIAPIDETIECVTQPLLMGRADLVYLMIDPNIDKSLRILQRTRKILDAHEFMRVEEKKINSADIYMCLSAYKEIFNNEGEHTVYVNISTGTKVTTAAGIMSCMIWDGTPYFSEKSDLVSKGKNTDNHLINVVEFPVLPIKLPKKDSISLIRILRESDGRLYKSELIKKLEKIGLIEISITTAAKHSKLKGLMSPLLGSRKPIITIDSDGKQSSVILTPFGKELSHIF